MNIRTTYAPPVSSKKMRRRCERLRPTMDGSKDERRRDATLQTRPIIREDVRRRRRFAREKGSVRAGRIEEIEVTGDRGSEAIGDRLPDRSRRIERETKRGIDGIAVVRPDADLSRRKGRHAFGTRRGFAVRPRTRFRPVRSRPRTGIAGNIGGRTRVGLAVDGDVVAATRVGFTLRCQRSDHQQQGCDETATIAGEREYHAGPQIFDSVRLID